MGSNGAPGGRNRTVVIMRGPAPSQPHGLTGFLPPKYLPVAPSWQSKGHSHTRPFCPPSQAAPMVACISSSRQAASSRTCAWMVRVPNPNSFSAPTAKLRSVHQRGPLEKKIPVVGTGKEAGSRPRPIQEAPGHWLHPFLGLRLLRPTSCALLLYPTSKCPIHTLAPRLLGLISDLGWLSGFDS